MESIQKYQYSPTQFADEDSFMKQIVFKNQIEFNEGIIQERHVEIEKIYKDVLCINEIFKDLNKIVLEQGESIIEMESNVDSTIKATESGIVLLKQAESYQNKWFSKRNKFILLGMVGLSINAPVAVYFGAKAGIISGLSTLGLSAITSIF
jgi:hypothetical protein